MWPLLHPLGQRRLFLEGRSRPHALMRTTAARLCPSCPASVPQLSAYPCRASPPQGGTSIEDLAEKFPDKIVKIPIDIREGITDAQAMQVPLGTLISACCWPPGCSAPCVQPSISIESGMSLSGNFGDCCPLCDSRRWWRA